MKIITNMNDVVSLVASGCVATIGNFDGVHKGHQLLIQSVVNKATELGLPSLVLTFDPHPEYLFNSEKAPQLLMTREQKLAAIEELGIDLSFAFSFTKEMAALAPETFVEKYFVDTFNLRHLFIGHDYVFGRERKGNVHLLKKMGQKFNFEVEQLQPVYVMDEIVSSTRIRKCLLAGDMQQATLLLGRHYCIEGEVVHGKGRGGKLLGFPTANLSFSSELLLPKKGVYASRVILPQLNNNCQLDNRCIDGNSLPGVTNIGVNPTFDDGSLSVETFLFDFESDIYHSNMKLYFIEYLRDEKRFSSIDDLTQQIAKDVESTRSILCMP